MQLARTHSLVYNNSRFLNCFDNERLVHCQQFNDYSKLPAPFLHFHLSHLRTTIGPWCFVMFFAAVPLCQRTLVAVSGHPIFIRHRTGAQMLEFGLQPVPELTHQVIAPGLPPQQPRHQRNQSQRWTAAAHSINQSAPLW
jgi:hypothetical protein